FRAEGHGSGRGADSRFQGRGDARLDVRNPGRLLSANRLRRPGGADRCRRHRPARSWPARVDLIVWSETRMNIAAIQLDIRWEDRAANHARVRELVSSRKISPGTLLVLPETFDTGFGM